MADMKDSEVSWIGEIPVDWNVFRFKDLTIIYTGNSIKDEQKENYEDNTNAKPYISSKDINTIYNSVDYENGMYIKNNDKSFKIAYKKSTLMCIEGGSAGKKKALINQDVCFVNKLCCFKANNLLDDEFLFYFLNNPAYEEEFKLNLSGMIGGVSVSNLKNSKICIPSLEQQHLVVKYLNKKCTEIDELHLDIEKQIKILEEYKKSVITKVIINGLNDDVDKKDSNVDWIGEIPKHWETIKIGRLFGMRNEKNHLSMDEVQLLSLYTGIGVFPHGEQEERGNKAVTVEGYKIVHKNDIVVNILLAWMGAIGISKYNGVTSPAYDVYVPDLFKVVPHYYHYVFRTPGIAGQCYKYGRGIMMMRWRTYSQEFKQISIPFPPLKEQQAIADYLDIKCNDIDSVIATKKEQLEILEQYKKSLIYEYVTGKKEVPDNE